MMTLLNSREKQSGREAVLTDYSKRRLLTYANSFKDLAGSLAFVDTREGGDRQLILEKAHLQEKQQVLCENMTEVSKILAQMANEVFQFVPLPERQRKRIIYALRMEKIYVTDIFYIQTPKEQESHTRYFTLGVQMYVERPGGCRTKDVADMLSVLMDRPLTVGVTTPYMVDKEEKCFVFVEEPGFMVLPGYATAVQENETISGDNYALIESVQGEFTMLLSDGMGSGDKACADSEKVLDLMEKLMEAGYDIGTAASLLNSALAAADETKNMSTLDICSVDLYSGMCQFRKMGASASFLKSNTYVEQISMNTLPLGIFQKLDTEVVTRELIENDYIIMVTDGVIEALASGGYETMLANFLEEVQETNPGEMARKVLQFALRSSGGRVLDDMTVVVLGVFRSR